MAYTVRPSNPPFERAVFGGTIQARPDLRHQPQAPARLSPDWLLAGYATAYGRPHIHKNRIEAFSRGAFCASLRTIRDVAFLRDHTWTRCLGNTADGTLELFETDAGLAFALHPAADEEGQALVEDVRAGRLQMSVGYAVEHETIRQIAGEDVALIERASLSEISAVTSPAVKQTTITAVRAATFGDLKSACLSGQMERHVAAAKFERAGAKLRELLG